MEDRIDILLFWAGRHRGAFARSLSLEHPSILTRVIEATPCSDVVRYLEANYLKLSRTSKCGMTPADNDTNHASGSSHQRTKAPFLFDLARSYWSAAEPKALWRSAHSNWRKRPARSWFFLAFSKRRSFGFGPCSHLRSKRRCGRLFPNRRNEPSGVKARSARRNEYMAQSSHHPRAGQNKPTLLRTSTK